MLLIFISRFRFEKTLVKVAPETYQFETNIGISGHTKTHAFIWYIYLLSIINLQNFIVFFFYIHLEKL